MDESDVSSLLKKIPVKLGSGKLQVWAAGAWLGGGVMWVVVWGWGGWVGGWGAELH